MDKPDQAVRLDEPFPEQDPDELPVLVPPRSELTRGEIVGLEQWPVRFKVLAFQIGLVRPSHPLGRMAVSMETPCT